MGKALVYTLIMYLIAGSWSGCAPGGNKSPSDRPFRLALDQVPQTLNPRHALDAAGQRLGALIFRGLVRTDSELKPLPDLAEKWRVEAGGRIWRFWVRSGLKDHALRPIDAPRLALCLERYRKGTPLSEVGVAIPFWKSASAQGDQVILELEKANPYLIRDVALLRYFTLEDGEPCQDPKPGQPVVGSGTFKPARWESSPQSEILLLPLQTGQRSALITFVKDETSRTMRLLKGDVDAIQNALSPTKVRWFEQEHPRDFRVLSRPGVSVSYLAFNLKHPILAKKKVRQAIASAIARDEIIGLKYRGSLSPAASLLAPFLLESFQPALPPFNVERAEQLLEEAGYPRDQEGIRIRLRYKTTPSHEGMEAALIFQAMLKKAGIELTLDAVEPAVFLTSVRQRAFQLYSSRWVGVSDGSILYRTLHTGQRDNRAQYESPAMDALLDEAMAESDDLRRIPVMKKIQALMAEDLPYLPLWYWTTDVVVRREAGTNWDARKLSASAALEPIIALGTLETQ